jgi:hypothetical protein
MNSRKKGEKTGEEGGKGKKKRELETMRETETSWARPSGNFLARSLFDRGRR